MSRTAVTADDLRRLATIDRKSLFWDADTLVLSDEGITIVPFKLVEDSLAGRIRFVRYLLFSRSEFADCGVRVGPHPKTFDGSSLDDRLARIAADINEGLAETTGEQP